MIRNELRNTAIDKNEAMTNTDNCVTALSDEQRHTLITAMKIAYYKDFYRRGIITADQLEQLLYAVGIHRRR